MNQANLSHPEQATALFSEGCQCAQATFCAFCDRTGLSLEDAMGLSASFGGGIARMRECCGALSGILMAAGLLLGRALPGDTAAKDHHYRLTQYIAARFKEKMGSIYCYRLLSLPPVAQSPVSTPRTEQFYQERPCSAAITAAAELLDEILLAAENGTLDDHLTDIACKQTTDFLNQR